MSPNLRPCFRYLSTRGLDRLLALFYITFKLLLNLQQKPTAILCGDAAGLQFCFPACPSSGGLVTRDLFHFSCYVYNNGNPDDVDMTPAEVKTLFDPLVVDNLSKEKDNVGRFCGTVGATALTETASYCMRPCTDFSLTPGMGRPFPPPCVYVYRGSLLETLVSRISSPMERPVENERLFCPFTSLDDERVNCQSETERMCRTDSQGVITLPPGTSQCLLYINGPAAAVGLLAASGFAGQVMTGLTGVTAAGTLATATTMMAMNECTAPLCVATSGQCCLLAEGSRGPICPTSC